MDEEMTIEEIIEYLRSEADNKRHYPRVEFIYRFAAYAVEEARETHDIQQIWEDFNDSDRS